MPRTSTAPRSDHAHRRRRTGRAPGRPTLSLSTALIFALLVALGATLFSWQFSVYRRWLASDRNPREGVLLGFAQDTRWDILSAFEWKNPALIREELATPPAIGGAKVHFLCPVSGEGNFLIVYLFRNSEEWWICALPIP